MRPRQTSRTPRKRHKNRIFWLSTTMVVLFVLSIFGLKSSIPTALAMEQATRCGLEEHVHDDDCYIDNVIICQQKAHSHSSNCYLLLLEDNDINMLLTAVSQTEDKNLESLIAGVLGEAVRLNDMAEEEGLVDIPDSAVPLALSADASGNAVMAASFRGTTYAGTEVSQLNNIIDTFALEPAMVLNEGMAVPMDAEESDSSNDGIMTVADPSTANKAANIYLNIDGDWQCIGTLPYTRDNYNYGDYYSKNRRIDRTTFLNAVNDVIEPNITTSDFKLYYSTSTTGNKSSAGSSGDNFTFGDNNNNAIYIWLYRSGTTSTSNTYSAKFYTVTKVYQDGTESEQIVLSGKSITLDNEYIWSTTRNGTALTNLTQPISGKTTFYARPNICTVTYHYPDGTTSTESVRGGSTITLDPDYTWRKGSATGTVVSGTETITSNTHYYASSVSSITLRYDVSFDRPSGTSSGTSPTLQGTAVTTISDTYDKEQGQTTATIRKLSSTEVACPVSNHNYGLTRISYFTGWKVENTETILSPRTTLTWQELKAYDTNGDGIVNLTGQWETNAKQTASFYLRLDSVAVDTNGNIGNQGSENYTNELFSTHVGGNFNTGTSSATLTTQYGVADVTADKSYTADQNIRKLVGNYSGDIWLYDFPDDEEMFAEIYRLTNTSDKVLTVEGEVVDRSKLNSNYYAIRWYVFKCQDDAWHIDGKLVKKEGVIHVDKTFAGNETLIERSKEDFYITAENAEKNKFYILTLEGLFDWEKPRHPAYREGATFLTPVDDDDGNDDTYLWEIDNVTHAEVWTVTEYPMELSEAVDYSEWMVVDSTATNAETSGAGTTVSITGVTHATDIDYGEYLSVEFNNIYYRGNSLMLKKEDKKTGKALAGAAFQLYQNDTLMTFRYDEENGLYIYDPRGTFSTLECDGYVNLSTTGFAYDYGPITVKEVKTPDGYNPIDDIVIGYTEDTNGDGVADSTVGILNTEISLGYAEYNNGLLIVKNSSDPIDITVEKIWNCDESEWADVKIELLANGSLNLAATLLADSGASPYVTLMAENQYTHTWYGLPASANNDPVRWTIRETKIGTENCKADYSFANWITSYSAPRTDENGDIYLSVTNTPTRPMLYLIKTDWSETLLLQGAQFRIIEVNSRGVEVGTEKMLTTNENGALLFDNLKHETRYKLTEITAPEGYWPYAEEVYLTIAQGGIITLEGDSEYVSAGDTAYQIQVKNRSSMPMPETGGNGTLLFTGLGMLMLFGVFTYQKKNARRKRRRGGLVELPADVTLNDFPKGKRGTIL